MRSEHLLDAIGLLDDDLIQEAEGYSRRKARPDHRRWAALAACLAVVVVLGYGHGLTHLGMGGGAPSNGMSGGAASAPSASSSLAQGNPSPDPTASPSGDSDLEVPNIAEPAAPGVAAGGAENVSGDWFFAIRVDGTVYWATEEYVKLELEEGEVRYTTSFIDSAEPEEDGQANFLPVGTAYVVLEDGRVAVLQEDTGSWRVYDPVPPWERP